MESKYIRSLLQSAQAGNNAALEQLFEMNLDRIYALSHRLTGNKQDAEFLAITVFVEAWKQLNINRPDIPFNLWLESITVHNALQQQETSKEKKKWFSFRKKKTEVKEPDQRLTPLGKEICKLPVLERNIFVLHQLEKYTVEELSSMLNTSTDKINEKLLNVNEVLLSKDFIQTEDVLSKRISEIPKQIKADTKILTEALQEIYQLKLKDRKEEEKEDEVQVPVETKETPVPVKPKKEKSKVIAEIGFELPQISTGFKRRIWWVVLLLATAIGIYFVISTGSKSWEVITIVGNVSIDGDQLKGNSSISTGETLQTGENSSVKISIPDVGSITVEALTVLKRLDKKNTAELIEGIIMTEFTGATETFTLKVPGSTISDYYPGSSYIVELKNNDSGQVSVNKSWIKIESNRKEVIAPENYIIKFSELHGWSMPFYKNANPELITAVEELATSKSELYVERIVSLATQTEAITLWNLLKGVNPGKRLLIYSKLNELVPHPETMSREDILNLVDEKLLLWLGEIKLKM